MNKSSKTLKCFLNTARLALLPIAIVTSMSAFSAIEYDAEQAAQLKPYKEIKFQGRFASISAQNDAAKKRAEKEGAHAFYITDSIENSNGRYNISVALYEENAEKNTEDTRLTYRGIKELSRDDYEVLEPFDYIDIEETFTNPIDINNRIAKLAIEKDAAAFYIIESRDANNSGTRKSIKALLYKKDAPRNERKQYDLIPAGSEAAAKAIAEGRPELVESPQDIKADGSRVKFWEGDSSSPEKRYTVTLADGTKVQEVNRATAAKMEPFDSIEIRGSFNTSVDISHKVAKEANKRGAKYYRITLTKEGNGTNKTIYVDLFK
ncbi:YdgH/BhsA/McbA-like domain containing protein [Thorsellia kenyensis]|uniref:YdgH/BhsA/McbA-like domain containing protein n=1 Tax=Thorsellia kenyensis TaxID=1549888 RepID=A0ABV6C8Y9_9GAMM